MWYVGIDWADEHHVVVVLDEQGQQVATKHVAHTVEGLAQLTTFSALHRRNTRAAGGAGMQYRNQPWTAHRRFDFRPAFQSIRSIPKRSIAIANPRAPKQMLLMLTCWHEPGAVTSLICG